MRINDFYLIFAQLTEISLFKIYRCNTGPLLPNDIKMFRSRAMICIGIIDFVLIF